MGSLGHSVYDAVDAAEHVLSKELGVLLDSIVESHCMKGLPATNSSRVTDGVSADGGAERTPSSLGVTLALGMGFLAVQCQRRSLMDGAALALGASAGCGGWGIWQWVCRWTWEWCMVWGMHIFGIRLGDACDGWLWLGGSGMVCAGLGMFRWIGHTYSLVLWYLLPWASVM